MSTGGEPGHLHRTPDGDLIVTRKSGYSYFFYDKHHGRGGSGDAQWAGELSEHEEFGIFDSADEHEIGDEKGHLYGLWVLHQPDGPPHEIRSLGTRGEQVAKFWYARVNQPWHGFPLWPIADDEAPNRAKEALRPPVAVFAKMIRVGLLTAKQRKRLQSRKLA